MNNLTTNNMPAPAPMATPLLGRAIAPYPVPANFALRAPNNVMIPGGFGAVAPAPAPAKKGSKTLLLVTLFLGVAIGGVVVWQVRPWYDGFQKVKNLINND